VNRWIAKKLIDAYEIIYIDDGSDDNTLSILKKVSRDDLNAKILSFSGNFGHQAALTAGYHHAGGDAVVSLDADLQDPPEVIEKMLVKFKEGFEIVYGVRRSRKKDTQFKRFTAQSYYSVMKFLRVNLIYNHADFRLISRKVQQAFLQYNEVNQFLRGIFPLLGFKQCVVAYEREKRFAGETKYPLKRMLEFAIEGITSFSTAPLRFASIMGIIIFFMAVVMGLWAFIQKMRGFVIPGWTSIVVPLYILSGIQMFILGIIGEYISKIYFEVKRRPVYIIKEKINIVEE
jgi:glycosyltransferase involved in cell wall biosynthesis